VSIHGGTVRLTLTLGIDALGAAIGPDFGRPSYDALASLVAQKVAIFADGGKCEPVPFAVSPPSPDRASVVIVVDYACPDKPHELRMRDNLSDALGPDYHTLANIEAAGGARQFVLEPDQREARVAVAASAPRAPVKGGSSEHSAASSIVAFFRLGIEHILTGFDHLLFLLALILCGGRLASLLAIVSSFTLAHSITLALAVLDVVSLPPWLIEPVIALSIIYVSAENIFFERAASQRWAVSFGFGLVHGFGFAGALLELELPKEALVGSLLSFNVGVEVGQGMVIGILVPTLAWLRRFDWEQRGVTTLSALVLTAGIALLLERVLLTAG
jgi:hydrogenase/urease accessory protein HupE